MCRRANIVRISVDKRRIDIVYDVTEQDWLEVAEYFRGKVRDFNYGYLWMEVILANVWRYSPKMRCWLIRECFSEMALHYWRGTEMKGKDSAIGKDETLPAWGFVNVPLSDEQREAAHLDYKDGDSMWDTIITVLRDGYKVTLSYDAETDAYCAALSGLHCGKPNERLSLTAWGESELTALQYVLYKHVTVLEFVWQKPGMKAKRLG